MNAIVWLFAGFGICTLFAAGAILALAALSNPTKPPAYDTGYTVPGADFDVVLNYTGFALACSEALHVFNQEADETCDCGAHTVADTVDSDLYRFDHEQAFTVRI